MQPNSSSRIPSYRLHKSCGLAVVRLAGKDIYLGKHGSEESRAEYRRVIAEWLASAVPSVPVAHGTTDPVASEATPAFSNGAGTAVNELLLAYLKFAKGYYVKNGRQTGEVQNLKDAIKPLAQTHGHIATARFGPVGLKAVRQAMIESNLCRNVVNDRVNRIRRVFKWGVENQLVPARVLLELQAVAPLKRGRCAARETPKIVPVREAAIEAVIKVAPPVLAAMIQLQRVTGMRPGEVVLMRTGDIDMSGPVWTYSPTEHKTEHHGRSRLIHLGPQAQAVLRPHLKHDLAAFIFSPREVMEWRFAERRKARVTPMTPSQMARVPKRCPERAPGRRYTTMTYARAISRLCDEGFPHPSLNSAPIRKLSESQRDELVQWQRVHRWAPNRLRHNAGTLIRSTFDLDAARVVLGHSSVSTTEIYAAQDLSKAAEIMGRVG